MLYVNPQLQSGYKDLQLSPGAERREAQALKEFERLFLFQMLKAMRKTVPDGGLFGGGMKREYFEEMLDDVMAGDMAESGQLGIARQMAAELEAKRSTRPVMGGHGIPINRRQAGISIAGDRVKGIGISGKDAGIALEKPGPPGIPLARAHALYRDQG